MDTPEPFDRDLRRIRRDRACNGWSEHAFLQRHMADELADRLASVTRKFSHALILGYPGDPLRAFLHEQEIATTVADSGFGFAQSTNGVQCDEDRLPFADHSFDLVLSVGVLDTVNDLPGALSLIRRILRPDGLFLGAIVGAGSLAILRSAMMTADLSRNRVAARVHPQIDVRAAGDLLGRAGFALPVADSEQLTVRYTDLPTLVGDLRGSAGGSLLGGPALSRTAYALANAEFEDARQQGKTPESFEIIYLTGWSPSPDQPQPAARGSATASLAEALRAKG